MRMSTRGRRSVRTRKRYDVMRYENSSSKPQKSYQLNLPDGCRPIHAAFRSITPIRICIIRLSVSGVSPFEPLPQVPPFLFHRSSFPPFSFSLCFFFFLVSFTDGFFLNLSTTHRESGGTVSCCSGFGCEAPAAIDLGIFWA